MFDTQIDLSPIYITYVLKYWELFSEHMVGRFVGVFLFCNHYNHITDYIIRDS